MNTVHQFGDVDADAVEEIAVGESIESETGLTVAFKFGKTTAREARFTRSGSGSIRAERPVDLKGYGRDWIIRVDNRIIAIFGAYEVIGIWESGAAEASP